MKKFNEIKSRFEKYLGEIADGFACEPILAEAMRYSLFSGGKRIRPVLLIAAAEMYGKEADDSVMTFAAAVECLHVYSLVHDDLPSMDNDDYRRGMLTSHKKFGEDIAILAGDALLSESFGLILKSIEMSGFSSAHYTAAKLFADKVGANGLISGQVRDLRFSGSKRDEAAVMQVFRGKTCALIEAAVGAGTILGGGSESDVKNMLGFAEAFGIAFQIADDILDDDGEICSLVTVCGKETAKKRLDEYTAAAIEYLNKVDCDTDFLKEFTLEAKNRKR